MVLYMGLPYCILLVMGTVMLYTYISKMTPFGRHVYAIGGASSMGGEGSVIGAIVGALVMATINNGMSLMNVPIHYQYIVKGLILLLNLQLRMKIVHCKFFKYY